MTPAQKIEFEALATPEARAAWLLDKGVTAALDIDAATLEPVWRACSCGVMLPGKYRGTEADAIKQGIAWLRFKAAV